MDRFSRALVRFAATVAAVAAAALAVLGMALLSDPAATLRLLAFAAGIVAAALGLWSLVGLVRGAFRR